VFEGEHDEGKLVIENVAVDVPDAFVAVIV
jgi:hypothetical protein